MKRLALLAVAGVSALAISASGASAQAWVSIDQRQAELESRIDAGVRNGDLTRDEALRVRGEFRDISDLELRYRQDGLNDWERNDLDRRFDTLSSRIRFERHDDDRRRPAPVVDQGPGWGGDRHWRDDRGAWMSINQRQSQLAWRIDQGVRSGRLTRAEAAGLNRQFQDLTRLERRYRAGGLTAWERADLDKRFDRLAARIRWEKADSDRRR